jgi:hypothetical protein
VALPPINGTPPQAPGVSQARAAAQRAFFDAAMGRAQAAPPTQAAAPAQARPTPVAAPPPKPEASLDLNAPPPDPTLRPGSIVNIRV